MEIGSTPSKHQTTDESTTLKIAQSSDPTVKNQISITMTDGSKQNFTETELINLVRERELRSTKRQARAEDQENPRQSPHKRYRSHSRSREPRSTSQSRKEATSEICKYYKDSGFCARGCLCHFKHDFNMQIDSVRFRIILDAISGNLYQIKCQNEKILQRVTEVEKQLNYGIDEITRDMRNLSLNPRNIEQKKSTQGLLKKMSLKDRVKQYNLRN